jgi:hypothetical protein
MSAVVKSTVNSLEEVKNLKAAQRKDIQKLESEMLKGESVRILLPVHS